MIARIVGVDALPVGFPTHRHSGDHQNLRGQAAGIAERLLQPCCMTDARTDDTEQGSALQPKARLPEISPMIWRRVLVPETMSLTSTGLGGLCRKALLEEAANALVKGRSTPHAQDQVSILVSWALQRGKLKSGNGTNGCLAPEILVVPSWSAVGYGVGIVELPCLRKSGPQMSAELLG